MEQNKSEAIKKAKTVKEIIDIEEKYPNEAKFTGGEQMKVNQDNHFINHDLDEIRKKYIKFTVYMEALNEVLELHRTASVEEFAVRIRDIVIAANQPE